MITAKKYQQTKPMVIVAGGAGFIGSFLCQALLSQGCQVFCLDNLSTGKKENLKSCFKNPNFSFIQKDLTKELFLNLPKDYCYIFDLTGSAAVLQNLIIYAQKSNSRIVTVRPNPKSISFLDYPHLRQVLVKEVYGPRMNLKFEGQVAQLTSSSFFVSDVVYGLIKIMFGIIDGKVIKIGESKFNWSPKVSLSEGIEQTLKYFKKSKNPKNKKENTAPVPKKEIKNRSLAIAFACLVLVISSPFISLAINLRLGVNYLRKSKQAILSGEFKKAEENAHLSQNIFSRGVSLAGGLQNSFDLLNLGNSAGGLKKFYYLGEQSAAALESASVLAQEGKLLLTQIFQNQSATNSLPKIKTEIDQLLLKVSLIETEVKNNQSIFMIARYFGAADLFRQLTENLPEARKMLIQAKKGITLLPILTGTDQPKTYLVLLQNSAELRPTGGFIGSYAILAFEKGKLAGLEVKNVYEADGQLKGHVEPPPALKRNLDIANWYLRDSNWDPDFPASAKKAIWFLEKETGQIANGVIGVDLYLARRLLSVFGEIKLPDYDQTFTAGNLFEKAEYYSEANFFSGSTQKEDFLGTLTRALFEKIKTADEKNLWFLSQALFNSLKAKDMQIYLNDPEATKVLTDLDWDGRIMEIDCPLSNSCFLDYLMIVEANVGVNKANYFVKRNLNHSIYLDSQGDVKESLKISYKNESTSERFPAGRYKNYLRVLTPAGTNLEEVKIDGRLVERRNIEEEVIAGKKAFGILIEVPIKEEKTVEVSYQLNTKLPSDKSIRYLFYLQKQSGIEDEKMELEFVPAEEIAVISVFPPAITRNQKYQFSQKFNQDLVFELQLEK